MKASDIPDALILDVITHSWLTHSDGVDWPGSLPRLVPELRAFPEKVLRAKLARLVVRGLIDGCPCGCRGNWTLPDSPPLTDTWVPCNPVHGGPTCDVCAAKIAKWTDAQKALIAEARKASERGRGAQSRNPVLGLTMTMEEAAAAVRESWYLPDGIATLRAHEPPEGAPGAMTIEVSDGTRTATVRVRMAPGTWTCIEGKIT